MLLLSADEIAAQVAEYIERTVKRFCDSRPTEERYSGFAVEICPFDPSLNLHIRWENPTTPAHAEAQGENYLYWAHDCFASTVETESDRALLNWLDDYLAAIDRGMDNGLEWSRLYEIELEAVTQGLQQVESLFQQQPFVPPVLCYAIAEEDENVATAIERYEAIRTKTLEPGWAKVLVASQSS